MIIQSIYYIQRTKTFIKGWIGFEPQESEEYGSFNYIYNCFNDKHHWCLCE